MSCFPCFTSKVKKTNSKKEVDSGSSSSDSPPHDGRSKTMEPPKAESLPDIDAKTFTFRELAAATRNFRQECLLGEGAFGRVYKGKLENTGQDVAVKQLDRNGLQGNKEFLEDVSMMSLLDHENLVNLVGYCADGEQRLLVCEYMSLSSLVEHLFELKEDQEPLSWPKRMHIALGAARGVEYLHEKANPPVLYRDLKSSNILLCDDLHPKLSIFGLTKAEPEGDKMHGSRVMGTYGYCAPEYSRHNQFTLKSDIYSYGVVLLEIITGRKAIDTTRPMDEQNLVSWAQPKFRDPKNFPEMADPLLKRKFPEKGLNQAVAIAAMCLQEESSVRPLISDVVTTFSFLVASKEENMCNIAPPPPPPRPASPPNDSDGEKGGDSSSGSSEDERSDGEESKRCDSSKRGSHDASDEGSKRGSHDGSDDDSRRGSHDESDDDSKRGTHDESDDDSKRGSHDESDEESEEEREKEQKYEQENEFDDKHEHEQEKEREHEQEKGREHERPQGDHNSGHPQGEHDSGHPQGLQGDHDSGDESHSGVSNSSHDSDS